MLVGVRLARDLTLDRISRIVLLAGDKNDLPPSMEMVSHFLPGIFSWCGIALLAVLSTL